MVRNKNQKTNGHVNAHRTGDELFKVSDTIWAEQFPLHFSITGICIALERERERERERELYCQNFRVYYVTQQKNGNKYQNHEGPKTTMGLFICE